MALTNSQNATLRNDANVKFIENVRSTFEATPLRKYVQNLTGVGQSLKAGWVGDIPRPQIRLEGDPPTERRLKVYSHSVTPQVWDDTVVVDQNFLDDAEQTGNIGGISDIGGGLGTAMAIEVLQRATDVLESGSGTTIATDYEGLAFLRTTHAESGSNQSNAITVTGISDTSDPTPTELEAVADAILVTALGHTSDQGRPWDQDAMNLGFMMPTAFVGSAANVFSIAGNLGGRQVSQVGTRSDSGLTTGKWRGYEAFHNGGMAATDVVYGLRSPQSGGGFPLIVNMRQAPDLIFRDRSTNSDRAIELDASLWTSKARFDVGFGQWRGAIKATLSA